MKTITQLILAVSSIIPLTSFSAERQKPEPTPFSVVDRGLNHKVWERTVYEPTRWGPVPRKHSFRELATGMHFLRNGEYIETVERFELLPNGRGAAATNGQHQLYVPADIYEGVIRVVGPDGRQQKMRPWGIAYDDGTSSVLIAELATNSVGVILPGGNQVIYSNCFTDFSADILVTYKKGGFECDLVFRQKPPPPENYAEQGLNPGANCRLQLLTEFFETADPVEKSALSRHSDARGDPILRFGALAMIHGSAFFTGDGPKSGTRPDREHAAPPAAPIYKRWVKYEDRGALRTFLVEETPYQRIKSKLDELASADQPERWLAQASGISPSPRGEGRGEGELSRASLPLHDSLRHRVSQSRLLSPFRPAVASNKRIQLAKADLPRKPGVTWDYTEVYGSPGDYTFQGDTTYFVSGALYVDTLTIEPGTVVKFPESGDGLVNPGNCVCQTQPYLPAVFTSENDDAIGEILWWSNGTPASGTGFYFEMNSAPLQHLRFCYASTAIYAYVSGDPFVIWDVQFMGGSPAIQTTGDAEVWLRNVLFVGCNAAVGNYEGAEEGDFSTLRGEHITADQTTTFLDTDATPIAYLTNCIFTALTTDLPSPGTNNNVIRLPSGSGVFQTVGGGSYYLATNSPFRNIGTTNLSDLMLKRLTQTTTYPPYVYSNASISTELTLGPQARRDTDLPDLGYHYDPLDYAFGGADIYSNITFTAGTAVGWFRTSSGYHAGHGIHMDDLQHANFNGTFGAPCYWARCSTVQEGCNGNWEGGSGAGGITGWCTDHAWIAPVVTARFTYCCQFVGEAMHFREDYGGLLVRLHDCEVYNGGLGGYGTELKLTNCLLHRVSVWVSYGTAEQSWVWRNCTLKGQMLTLDRHYYGELGSTHISIRDCAFDSTAIPPGDPYLDDPAYSDFDFNAYLDGADRLEPEGASDVIVFDFNWQNGPLGRWYFPGWSDLVDAGDQNPDALGLYHFTTQTDNTKDGPNPPVDIGYHHVAVDGNNNALDTDGDGIADYIEDGNGNGTVDNGETDWNSATDLGLKVIITRPKSNSTIP